MQTIGDGGAATGRGSLLAFVTVLTTAALTFRVDGALFPIGLIAAVVVTGWCWQREWQVPPRSAVLVTLAVLVGCAGWTNFAGWGLAAVVVGAAVVVASALSAGRLSTVVVVVGLVAGVVVIGTGAILDPDPNDVMEAHRAATERVVLGESPYHDLGIVESNPFNHGAPIEGYSYPPLALVVFGITGRAVGGADTVTIVLWAVIVAVAIRRYGAGSTAAPALALVPGLAVSAVYGWTEPLTILLVLGALHAAGTGRSVLVGVAMASKQYLVLAAPAVVASWWRHRRWLWIAAAAAIAVTVPVLVDPSGAFTSLVSFHLHRPVRPDSSNLAGFLAGRTGLTDWPVPSAVVAVVASGFGALVARRHGSHGWLHGMVATLVLTLVIGPVALMNYWILVAALVLLVVGERELVAEPDTGRPVAGTTWDRSGVAGEQLVLDHPGGTG